MLIFDGHSDVLVDITARRLKGEKDVFKNIHLPKLQKGGINALVAAVWIEPKYDDDPAGRMYQLLENGFADFCQLDNVVFPVKNGKELRAAVDNGKIGIILGMEGLSGLEKNPEGMYMLYNMGVRHASLTWNEANYFATGVRAPQLENGVTAEGKKVIRIMEELGIMIDVSHANEKTFWDVLNMATGPIIATHSNAYNLCPVPRNLKDEQIKAIADSNGLIGINAWPEFIDKTEPDVEKLINHIDYLVEKAGIDRVAFGFDFVDFLEEDAVTASSTQDDGPKMTKGLHRAEDVPNLVAGLKNRCYKKEDLEKLCFLNMESLFNRVCKEK